MILDKIISHLEREFPKRNAEHWDNVGLLIGDRKQNVKKILLALDLDEKALNFGINEEVDLIITHHPFIFNGVKSIDLSSTFGKKLEKIIKNDISVYSLHTNIDSTKGGLNDYIVEKLNVETGKILDLGNNEDYGIGRYFKIKETKLEEYLKFVKEVLEIDVIRVFTPDIKANTKKVALINGGGASYFKKAMFYGVDLVLTGDVKYHEAHEAIENGVTLVDLGHYESEKLFMELVEKKIKEIINKDDENIEVIKFLNKPLEIIF